MGRIRILLLKDPNRGFLRERGCVEALASAAAITLENLRAGPLKPHELLWLAREREICAAEAALYVFRRRIVDRFERLGCRHANMTLGLTTALWFANVLAERPAVDHWLISHSRWRPVWLPTHARVHMSRHARGDTFVHRVGRIDLHVSKPRRAVLDCIRFRGVLGRDTVLTALGAVLERGLVEPQLLREYARRERIEKPLLELLAELHHRPDQRALASL